MVLLRLLWGYLSQLKVLLIKNWKLSYRNWKTTAAQLLAPVVFLLLLLVIQHVPAANKEDKAPKPQNVQHIPLCQGRHKGDTDCYPLFYYPTNNTKVNSIMNILAEKNNLSISFDLKDKQHIIGWSNSTSLYQYLKNNPNKTLAAVDWDIHTDGSGVEQVKFNLLYNSSCPSLLTSCVDWRPVMWRALGEALAVQYHGNKDTNWTLAQSTYPILNPPSDAVKTYGILFFYCGSMFFFIILLYQITYEKENKLRLGMRTMGLKGSMYWFSWFITAQILNFLSCLLLIAVGNACDFQFFRNTSFAVLLVIFFVFQLTMSLMAFFCSTFLPTTKLAIYISMMLFIIGVLLTLILSVFGSFVFMELYTGGDVATTFRWLLTCLPMYNFAKAVFDVNNMSFSLGAITGQGYTWSDLYKKGALGENELIPPTIDSIYANLVLCGAFIVFSWYLDNVVGGHGVREPFYFLFTPRYWGLQRKPRMPPGTELQKSMSVSGDDEFFNNDRQYKQKQKADSYQSVIGSPDDFGENLSGLQAINLQKYYSSMFGLRKFHALRGFNANISEGNIFCLLGHNGAGKTTTVSILTGLLDATGGEGWIFGYNVNAEMDKIRAIMGVCPQHDILWDGLTAAEHLQLFAELKQVPRTQIRTEVAEKLDSVGLLSVANNQVSGFSGGMKRRLSVAMSCIGNPKIIFLDGVCFLHLLYFDFLFSLLSLQSFLVTSPNSVLFFLRTLQNQQQEWIQSAEDTSGTSFKS
ncbi:ABC transporter, ATPbinding domain containing protein, variant 2 [Balamuthia mandrillaris]